MRAQIQGGFVGRMRRLQFYQGAPIHPFLLPHELVCAAWIDDRRFDVLRKPVDRVPDGSLSPMRRRSSPWLRMQKIFLFNNEFVCWRAVKY